MAFLCVKSSKRREIISLMANLQAICRRGEVNTRMSRTGGGQGRESVKIKEMVSWFHYFKEHKLLLLCCPFRGILFLYSHSPAHPRPPSYLATRLYSGRAVKLERISLFYNCRFVWHCVVCLQGFQFGIVLLPAAGTTSAFTSSLAWLCVELATLQCNPITMYIHYSIYFMDIVIVCVFICSKLLAHQFGNKRGAFNKLQEDDGSKLGEGVGIKRFYEDGICGTSHNLLIGNSFQPKVN